MASVSFEQATRRYPGTDRPALDRLDLIVGDGEFVVLVGPSGCGKTTSLRMVAGLETLDCGRIRIGERDVTEVDPKDRDVAMVFQNYALYPHMTVAQNMGFALKVAKIGKAEIRARVLAAAKLLDLQSYLDRKPKDLSGGQRQRVAMGRAIVRRPQVFLMDEPLSNLDAKLRGQTRNQIAALQRQLGTTTVYVTHDQVEAMTMGDRVAVLSDGVLQQCASPRELYRNPGNVFVAGFIGSPAMNLFRLSIADSTVSLGDWQILLPRAVVGTAAEVIIGVRPNIWSWAAPASRWTSTWSKNLERTPTCMAESCRAAAKWTSQSSLEWTAAARPSGVVACGYVPHRDTCTSSPSTGVGFRANVALVSTARVDLVCEGGGVRGIGLVGAVDALADAGYRFPRVAGSSAGAIVASLVAALQTAGEPVTRLAEMMRSIDYPKFLDRNLIGHVPLIGGGLSLLLSDGVYRGAYLEQLLGGLLADLGVHTFGDLRTGEAPEQFAWSLVVTASDLSRRRLVRIPWDLDSYGIHPDDFSVARAVHASSAIPFVFEPVRVRGATWVDGGLLSNFPVALFDRTDAEPRWPTFGIRLSARPGIPPTRPVQGPVSLGIAAIETLVSNQDNAYIDDPCTVRRTIFVPAHDVSPIDFDITAEQREALYQRGFQAGQKFLANWNYADYLADCGGPFTPSL